MNNCFPLDFIRQIIEQTLLEQKLIAPTDYFGGKNEVNLFSFYEQLQKDSEVNRYVEIYQDLVEQQNRSGLIMNGTIIAPENPTITNLYLDTIIPMSFTCSFRVMLGDRDKAITTINNLIEKLKGRKQDVALFNNGQILKVGCIANDSDIMFPTLKNGDYIGTQPPVGQNLNTFVNTQIASYMALGVGANTTYPQWYYYSFASDNKMYVAYKFNASEEWSRIPATGESESDYPDILFPPYDTFDKYKVSMSFDSIRCDEPRNLNAKEYCTISFGGSATLVNNGVALGNDLVKLGITRNKIIASPNIVITESADLLSNATWLEPLEMPSGNNANSITNLLNSNRFNTNSHTTNITIANQYSFVVDRSIPLLDQLYKYARWGYFGVDNSGETADYTNAITPNMIFRVYEVNSSWGKVEINYIDAKIVESIDIENTESDTLSMTLTLQKQGGNDISGSGGGGGGGGSTDYVTTDTEQTITAKKTFTNQVVFTNTLSNGTYVYLLPQESGRLATQEWVTNQNYATLSVISENYVSLATTQTITGDKSFKSSLSADKEIRITTSNALIESQYTTGYQYASFDFTGFYVRHYRTPSTGYKFTADGFEYYVSDVLNATFLLPTGSNEDTYTIATQEWVNSQGFLTSHQSLANYVTLDTAQTITGEKTFVSGNNKIAINLQIDNDNEYGISICDKNYTTYKYYFGLETTNATHDMKINIPFESSSSQNTYTLATREWVISQGYATQNNFVTIDTNQTITGDKTFSGTTNFNGVAQFNSDSYYHHTPIEITVNSGYAMSIFGDGAQYGYYFNVENENPNNEYELTIPAETGILATREYAQNLLTPSQVGTGTTTTITTSQGTYKGFQFYVGNDRNGLYVFTYGYNMVLLPAYGLQTGMEYKIPATLIRSGSYDTYILTYRVTSDGYMQIYNKNNYIETGYTAYLFKVKLY